MPDFLVPFPPTLTPTSESRVFSGSSLSLSSNSSFNYFRRLSHASSGSAYLTDLTPPITPSHDKEHGKSCSGNGISVGPSIGPFKRDFEDRDRRALLVNGQAEDTGYSSDCEREDAPLLDVIDLVRVRLKKAKPTANTQRALKIMEEHTNPASESDALLDEPLLVTPSMQAMKVTVTKVEGGIEDRTGEFNDKTKIEAEAATPPVEEVGPTPTQEFTFFLDKKQIWENFADSEFEKAFHEGVREDMGRSYFPDEIKLHPANSFAFGTGNISGWREKPAPVPDACTDAQFLAGSERLAEQEMEPVSDTPVEQETVPPSSILVALSPAMPDQPVLRPLDDLNWTCSPLSLSSLSSPSLVYDTSVSVSQMLVSPHDLDAAPMASSPGVYDSSCDNPNSLISPLIPISTFMFASRRAQLPHGDMLTSGQDLDLPSLMRLEIDAAPVIPPRQQQLEVEAGPVPNAFPSGGFGLGFDVHSSQLPESSFPSFNSLPSIYSLPSWDPEAAPTTSTPPMQSCNLLATTGIRIAVASEVEPGAGLNDAHVVNTSDIMEVSPTQARQALSDITEESSRTLAMANESSKPPVVGLGLGGLLESTLQSSSSISLMRSPELFPITGTVVCDGFSTSVSMMDVADGRYHFPIGHVSRTALESSGVLECNHFIVNTSQIEPSGVLSETPQEIRHYSPGVENWRRLCAEVEPLSVPLDRDISNHSPVAISGFKLGYSYSEIDPPSGPSESSSANTSLCRQALVLIQGFPLPHSYSPEREDIATTNEVFPYLLTAGNDPRSPVSSNHQINHSSFAALSLSSQLATVEAQQLRSPGIIIEQALRNPLPTSSSVEDLIFCAPPSERSSLRSSKSAEGIGMGLPSNLAGRPPRQHDISSNGSDNMPKLMSTAEECQNLAKLSASSPVSDSDSPTFMVSEDRGGSRFFFKIPKFAKRNLYAIPEVISPTFSSAASSAQSVTSRGRLLSEAWSDFTNRLRSPCKSSLSKFSISSPQFTSPLAGSLGDARSSATAITQLSAIVPDVPSLSNSLTKDISQLPQPPVLVPKQSRFSMLGRLSGFSRSYPHPVHEGNMSPGVVERLDVPRGLGIFKRKPSPTTPSDHVKKENRFKPALRRFQLLF